MAFASRGLFDEGHAGEIDPGVQRIYDAAGNLRGFAWINKHPEDGAYMAKTKWVLLFEQYQVPGDPGAGRTPKVALRFEWSKPWPTVQQAIAEYHKVHPNAAYTLVKHTVEVADNNWGYPNDIQYP